MKASRRATSFTPFAWPPPASRSGRGSMTAWRFWAARRAWRGLTQRSRACNGSEAANDRTNPRSEGERGEVIVGRIARREARDFDHFVRHAFALATMFFPGLDRVENWYAFEHARVADRAAIDD